MNEEEIIYDEEELIEALENKDIETFRSRFLVLHPYDRATFYKKVDTEVRKIIYYYLSPKELAEIFELSEIDDEDYKKFLSEMDTTYAADMLSYMFVDNAVDVLNELDKAQVVSYLTLMNQKCSERN